MKQPTHGTRGIHGAYKATFCLSPIVGALVERHWSGIELLPREGPFIVVPNHISDVDPLAIGYFLGSNGYEVRFLAKQELFKIPVVAQLMRAWRMLPVQRGAKDAVDALAAAKQALQEGDVVGIYTEGTITRNPGFWPMTGKTGAARLALDTKVPVYPIAQWGPQYLMERYLGGLHFGGKPPLYAKVLPPVDLSDLTGDSSDHEAVNEGTRRIQAALLAGVANLRGEVPPTEPWDLRKYAGPGKKQVKSLSKWRKQLAKATGQRDILPLDLDSER